MAHDDVRLPVADQARDGAPVLERGHELAVVDVEDLVLDAEDLGALGDLRLAPLGQRAARHCEVPHVAVRGGDELHLVAGCRPQGRDAGSLQLGVVGMGAEGDDAQGLLLRLRGRLAARD
jgi:hypothetical protein